MGRPPRGNQAAVDAYRHIVETEGHVALTELIENRLDRLAGPWALTADEIGARRACRARFGHYDPTNQHHILYLGSLRTDGGEVAA